MKKSLIALAVLATTGAFAQSSVTLYGRMDLGTSGGSAETFNAAGDVEKTKKTSLAGAQNSATGSRLGVRGSEDLGGGLKANFAVETRIDPDANLAGTTFGMTRLALLQVAGDFGSVTVGTYNNPFDDIRAGAGITGVAGGSLLDTALTPGAPAAALPPLSDISPAAVKARAIAANNPAGNTNGLGVSNFGALPSRVTNALGYRSPVFAGGFTAIVGTTSEKTDVAGSVAPHLRGLTAGLAYVNGPINVLAAYGTAKATITGVADSKLTDFGIKASYNLGVAVPYISYEKTKVSTTAVATDGKANGFELGATFPMGAITPYISFGNVKRTLGNEVTKINGFQLGSQYALSKRTYLYGAIGSEKAKVSYVGDPDTGTLNKSGYAAGLVHNF